MFFFWKLVLAHLIADFILQFEELYRLKVKSELGHFFHALIHWLCMLLLAAPYLNDGVVLAWLTALAVIHHYQDLLKYDLQKKHPRWIFALFTVDQIFHVLFLATVLFYPEAWKSRPLPGPGFLNSFYTDTYWTLYAVLFIGGTFKATYFLHALRCSFFRGTRPDHFITSFEVAHGLLERTVIMALFMFMPLPIALAVTPLAGIPRLFSASLRSITDFLLSAAYAAGAALLFRPWIGIA